MKKNLLKNVKSYSALAVGLLAADAVQAQIVYTDVDPDMVVHGNFEAADWHDASAWASYQIDLDDDGNTDYTMRILSGLQHGVGNLDPAGDNQYVNNPANPFAAPLEKGVEIGASSQEWKGLMVYPNGYNYLGTITTFGKTLEQGGGGFTGKNDKYVGLKFKIGSKTHYGWARLDARDDSRQYTLKDFAYESTPDKAIKAGDGQVNTGISKLGSKDMKINTVGKNISIELANKAYTSGTVKVFNIAGQEVLSAKIDSKNHEFSVNAISGIYLVKVSVAGTQYSQKIYIK
jgi:hypothetical protein